MIAFPPTELHFTQLKRIERSPAHFRAGILNPRPQSPAMAFGTLVHSLVLGGEVIVFEGRRAGNAWAAFKGLVDGEDFFVFDGAHRGKAWAEAKEEAAGRLIVTSEDVAAAERGRRLQAAARDAGEHDLAIVTRDEYREAERVAASVDACADARPLLVGAKEVDLRWEVQGQACAGHLDVLGGGFVTDLKTTASSEPGWFSRQADRLGYHAQLDWYANGARENGFEVRECHIVAVEPAVPYAVTVFNLTMGDRREGEKRWRLMMERYLGCLADDTWPAYVQGPVDLNVLGVPELIWGDEDEEAA